MKFLRMTGLIPALLIAALSGCKYGDNNSASSSSSGGPSSSSSSSSSSSGSSGSSSSSSSSGGSPGAVLPISGKLVQAPLAGATVTAYLLTASGAPGTQALGSATSGSDGSFDLNVTLPAGTSAPVDLILVSSGGQYASEANITNTITNPSSGAGLEALLPQVPGTGQTGVVVSPMTTLVAMRTQGVIAGAGASTAARLKAIKETCTGGGISCAAATADAGIKSAFGFSSAAAPFNTLAPDFSATSGDGAVMALVLGSFEQEAVSVKQPPISLIGALASDYYDGVPDGNGPGGGPVKYPGTTTIIPPTLGSGIFLSNLSSYLTASATPPAGVMTASNGVSILPAVVSGIRSGIASVAPASAGLLANSSGAIAEISDAGAQLVLVAANNQGLQAVNISNPAKPVLLPYTKLNAALQPILSTVNGVVAVPGQTDAEALAYSFSGTHLVLVDLDQQTILNDTDFASVLTVDTSFSGGDAFISSGVYATNAPGGAGGVELATAEGFIEYDVASHKLGTPIPLSATQIPPENLGAATSDNTLFTQGLLFSGNYGPGGSGGGLQLVDIGKGTAYAMSDSQYQSDFSVTEPGGVQVPFGIVDGNSVDAVLHVGVTSGEHTDYAGLLDLHDASKYSFTGTGSSAAFTVATTAVARTQPLSDDLSGPTLSGVAVEPTNHYALFIDEFGSSLAVGLLDDPARPANGSAWQGFIDWRYYNAESSEYEGAGYDPHAVGALQAAANSKSYGFALSDASGTEALAMIDLAAFTSAAAMAAPSGDKGPEHELASDPFVTAAGATPIIQIVALDADPASGNVIRSKGNAKSKRQAERRYGMLVQRH